MFAHTRIIEERIAFLREANAHDEMTIARPFVRSFEHIVGNRRDDRNTFRNPIFQFG